MPNPSTIACDEQPAIQSWSREGATEYAVGRTCSAIYEAAEPPVDPLFGQHHQRFRVVTFQAVDQADALSWLIDHGFNSGDRRVVAILGCSIGADALDTTFDAIEARRARWDRRAEQWDRNTDAGRQCWDDGDDHS